MVNKFTVSETFKEKFFNWRKFVILNFIQILVNETVTNCGMGMWKSTCVFERNLRGESSKIFKVEPGKYLIMN